MKLSAEPSQSWPDAAGAAALTGHGTIRLLAELPWGQADCQHPTWMRRQAAIGATSGGMAISR